MCITKDRPAWLRKVIRLFQSQTYRKRELLIVADGASVRDVVPKDDARIRLFEIEAGRNIGEKRNFAASIAAGEILAHWDDDDYSAPDRVAIQVEALRSTRKAVTG